MTTQLGLRSFGFIGMNFVHKNLKRTLFVAKDDSDREHILDTLCKDVTKAYNAYDHSYKDTGILRFNVETLERNAVKRFMAR